MLKMKLCLKNSFGQKEISYPCNEAKLFKNPYSMICYEISTCCLRLSQQHI